MKSIANFFGFFIAIGVIGSFAWGIYMAGRHVIQLYNELDQTIAIILLFLLITLLFCSLIIASAIRRISLKGNKVIPQEKAAIYNNFVAYFSELKMDSEVKAPALLKFKQGISLWGDESVIKTYLELQLLLDSRSAGTEQIIKQAEKVIFAMRKDIGLSIRKLKSGDIAKIIF